MADAATLEILMATAEAHAAAPWRGKGRVIADAAAKLGCAAATVHIWLKDRVGYETGAGRKTRSDKGQTAISDEALQQIAGLAFISRRGAGNGGTRQMLSIRGAAKLVAANGGEVGVSASTISRQLRRRGLHPALLTQATPHSHQQSLHPNHVWAIDASLSVLFYMADAGLEVMNEDVFYKNKPQNIESIGKQRLNRWLAVDHYSGAFYLEYRLGGESQESLTEVFINAIQLRPGDPFHGVPLLLSMDAGSANISHAFLNLLKNLACEALVHTPGNPRAKGAVEVMQRVVEYEFEARFPFGTIRNLGHLNFLARQWSIAFNGSAIHTRHGQPRYTVWMGITAAQLRLAPGLEMLKEMLTSKPEARKVGGDLTISFKVKGFPRYSYDVRHVPGVMVGEKLLVRVNPYRAPQVDVLVPHSDPEQWLTVEHLVKNEVGFFEGAAVIGEEYKALPETAADQMRKLLNAQAYGTTDPKEADKRRRKGAPAYDGAINAFADVEAYTAPEWLPKKGTPLHLATPAREAAPLSVVDAAIRLRERLGRNLSGEEFESISGRFPDGVPEGVLEDLVNEFAGRPALRLVAGGR
ncbi:MAG: DDE-type integrase/transposase/recombinase [Magnetococcales bacterium]|nr:DDE-type integrase/transposase/recombinase [Magnetococcales bacterium]